jgi:GDSL-like Lipase/Acylhydrolase family
MRSTIVPLLTLLLLVPYGQVRAEESPAHPEGTSAATKKLDPVYVDVPDVPGLPRVLIIGDSVSCGYTLPLRAALAGKANVHRPPQNCGSSAVGLKNLDTWLGSIPWDVIHFNHGLHDLSYEFSPGMNRNEQGIYARPETGGHPRVSLDAYRNNLQAIVAKLRDKAPTATVIFATTTPVSADLHHYVKDSELPYNQAALAVMLESHVQVDDLWTFAKPRIAEIQEPGNPHFNAKGSEALAHQIAQVISAALEKRTVNDTGR